MRVLLFAVERAGAPADNRAVVESVGKAEPRGDIVDVIGAPGWQERAEAYAILVRVVRKVISHAQIQRQSRCKGPVILYPEAICMPRIDEIEVPDALPPCPGNWRQCGQVPGRHVKLIRKQLLDIAGNRPEIRR